MAGRDFTERERECQRTRRRRRRRKKQNQSFRAGVLSWIEDSFSLKSCPGEFTQSLPESYTLRGIHLRAQRLKFFKRLLTIFAVSRPGYHVYSRADPTLSKSAHSANVSPARQEFKCV